VAAPPADALSDDQSDALENLLNALEPISAFDAENEPEQEMKRVVH
jgi:hypothetical protein